MKYPLSLCSSRSVEITRRVAQLLCTPGINLVQMVKKVNVVVKEMLHCYDLAVNSPMVKAQPVRTCIHTKKMTSGHTNWNSCVLDKAAMS